MTSSGEIEVRLEQLLPVMQETLAAGQSVTFVPRGTSMLPMLHPGADQVTLSPLPEKLKKYDLPLYRRENGQFVLHRVVKVGETYTCCGDNQYVPEAGLRREQMIGLVTAFVRNGKRYTVKSSVYWLYSRCWCASRSGRYFLRRVRNKLSCILHKTA